MGREIAQVMGHEAADWLERPERDREEHTELLVEELNLKPGEIVADIGAGTGYFSRRLARKVGVTGKVLAVDIQPEMLALLTNTMAADGLTNVVPILGSTDDPKLPAASVDLVLMVDMYHEFDFPAEIMEAICRSVKPGGRVVFVEYRGEDPAVPIKPLHKMTELQVKKEMSALPLDWVQTIEVLPRQHIIIFRKRPPRTSSSSVPGQGARFLCTLLAPVRPLPASSGWRGCEATARSRLHERNGQTFARRDGSPHGGFRSYASTVSCGQQPTAALADLLLPLRAKQSGFGLLFEQDRKEEHRVARDPREGGGIVGRAAQLAADLRVAECFQALREQPGFEPFEFVLLPRAERRGRDGLHLESRFRAEPGRHRSVFCIHVLTFL
jgi:SAM-dependent methyltransferase